MERSSFNNIAIMLFLTLAVGSTSYFYGVTLGVKSQLEASPYSIFPGFQDEFDQYRNRWERTGGTKHELLIMGKTVNVEIVATTRGSAFGFSKDSNNPDFDKLKHLAVEGCTVKRIDANLLFWSFENPFGATLLSEKERNQMQ